MLFCGGGYVGRRLSGDSWIVAWGERGWTNAQSPRRRVAWSSGSALKMPGEPSPRQRSML